MDQEAARLPAGPAVTVDPRRLFKRPRHPLQWPRRAYVLIVLLVVVVALALAFAIAVSPSEFPPTKVPDEWAAEGAVFAAGAFLLAVLATAIATVAYINSTEKPALRIILLDYPGVHEPVSEMWEATPPGPSGQTSEIAFWLALWLRNDGQVAARFVAIRLTVGPDAWLHAASSMASLEPWQAPSPRQVYAQNLRWEGGADAVIHPSWEYEVPQVGPTYLMLNPQLQTNLRFEVEVVADDVPAFRSTYVVKVPRNGE
jgi:hypothetical protein